MKRGSKRDTSITYSIVVPTFHEADNIKPLTVRLFQALKEAKIQNETELIVVDDNSNDGIEEIVKKLNESEEVDARIIVRRDERGLSGAVLRGFDEARGQYLMCMDADLQHPPESVPELLSSLSNNNSNNSNSNDRFDFVIGTRYGGTELSIDKNWPIHRRILSTGARLLARPLSPLSDPMTGFFGIQRETYQSGKGRVSPVGFKIALELYVKCGIKKHREVPIVFGVRSAGESKLTSRVMAHYLQHLFQLYLFSHPVAFPLFILSLFVLFFVFAFFVWQAIDLVNPLLRQ